MNEFDHTVDGLYVIWNEIGKYDYILHWKYKLNGAALMEENNL